jgi:hypothetical protein
MKAYVYAPDELVALMGARAFDICEKAYVPLPSTLEETRNKQDADWFYIPLDVGVWEARAGGIKAVKLSLLNLPFLNRHFFFMHSDNSSPVGVPCVIFRQSCNRLIKDRNTISFPARVDDFIDLVNVNYDELPYSVCLIMMSCLIAYALSGTSRIGPVG